MSISEMYILDNICVKMLLRLWEF